MKYIITALLVALLAFVLLLDRDWQHDRCAELQRHIEIPDSLQALVDVCDGRVNDMRLQRDHAIEINNRHETRWNEMIRVRP